jgi:hypothetical protein
MRMANADVRGTMQRPTLMPLHQLDAKRPGGRDSMHDARSFVSFPAIAARAAGAAP